MSLVYLECAERQEPAALMALQLEAERFLLHLSQAELRWALYSSPDVLQIC